MAKNRDYSCKDVEMLLSGKVIVESFRTNLIDLSKTRSDWTEVYAADLSERIENAFEQVLGVDQKKGCAMQLPY